MRFAVLTHDWPQPHFDLLLEDGDECKTYRLLGDPATADPAGDRLLAEPLPRHRTHYLTYEGPVSGGRGSVARWDAGTYRQDEDALIFEGTRLRGRYAIRGGVFGPAAE